MSVLEQVLEEELDRSSRLSEAMRCEMESLPKGSIRKREVRGRVYYYLTHREGDRVISDYVRADDVDRLRGQLERRKELKRSLSEQKKVRRQLCRALGRKCEDG